MARPIKETPILYGEDARRFEERMKERRRISTDHTYSSAFTSCLLLGRMHSWWRLIVATAVLLPCWASTLRADAKQSYPIVRMQVERLPDLNVPRIGHSVMVVNGEPTVFGGHTTGFVPTKTAEYYRDGAWHLMPMAYIHDQGGMMVSEAGDVLLFGGHEQELGIGQTFTLERYEPATHSFRGYGSLDTKRCFANALPMDSGSIVISGNWYRDDCIEVYDGSRQCKFVKPVAQHRSLPHILRTARDNAIIFSAHDIHADDFDTIIIDHLKGEPFTDSLFNTWIPYCYPVGYHGSCFIGDEKKGEYTNLIQVVQGDTLMAIVRVEGEAFALLPTTSPIPMQSQWGRIVWFSHIVADRRIGRAYIEGYGEDQGDHRFYVAAIDYLKHPAPVTLYYSEPQDSVVRCQPILTSDGDLMLAGGVSEHHNNYEPSARVFLLRMGTPKAATIQTVSSTAWMWVTLATLLLVAIAATLLLRRRKKPLPADAEEQDAGKATATTADEELMARIGQLMDEQQLFLNADLKIADVAKALGTNATYVSRCINAERGATFSQFVNGYRISHAQQLLRRQPDMKIAALSTDSGFANETTFFRAFKALTGMTPREWMAQTD